MNDAEITLLAAKGVLADLPDARQATTKACLATLREMLAAHPDGEAHLAFVIVASELQRDQV